MADAQPKEYSAHNSSVSTKAPSCRSATNWKALCLLFLLTLSFPVSAQKADEKPTEPVAIASAQKADSEASSTSSKALKRGKDQPVEAFTGQIAEQFHLSPTQAEHLTRLFTAYASVCEGVEADEKGRLLVVVQGGKKFLFTGDKEKSFDERMNAPDLEDMMHDDYPLTLDQEQWPENLDPGRYRNEGFLAAVYGGSEDAVQQNLESVDFLGSKVRFNKKNGAAEALRAVAKELKEVEAANPKIRAYTSKSGGTFQWRKIANSKLLSAHSFGVAIDLNPDLGGYWEWEKKSNYGAMKRRLDYPKEIIEVFEKHGFIWGGKWWHFDLMHFEYRPEVLPAQHAVADTLGKSPNGDKEPEAKPTVPKALPVETGPHKPNKPGESSPLSPLPDVQAKPNQDKSGELKRDSPAKDNPSPESTAK